MEVQIYLMAPVSSCMHHFPLYTMDIHWQLAGQSITEMGWASNQVLELLAVWAAAKSCWNITFGSLFRSSAEGITNSLKTFY